MWEPLLSKSRVGGSGRRRSAQWPEQSLFPGLRVLLSVWGPPLFCPTGRLFPNSAAHLTDSSVQTLRDWKHSSHGKVCCTPRVQMIQIQPRAAILPILSFLLILCISLRGLFDLEVDSAITLCIVWATRCRQKWVLFTKYELSR